MALIVDIRKKTGAFSLDVSFEVKGGVHALLGGSGSGKSMTLKCIAGILTPDEGHISLDGKVLYDSKSRINLSPQKRNVGYMFQDYALFPTMTVLRNVMEAMGRRRDRKKAEDLLRRFHVLELADRLPGRLSGGQKQRVAMARIAAQDPLLVLLDEPFSALDSHLRWVLQKEMKEVLQTMGRPAVLVTHSRDEVYRLCSSVCCLQDGRSENTLPVRDFFRNPGTVAGAKLSGCKNVSSVRILDSHRLFSREWQTEFFFRNGIPEDKLPWLYAVGIRAHRFHADRRTGDDNEFVPVETMIMEDPFEWNISFYSERGRADAPEPGGSMAVDSEEGGQDARRPLLWRTAKNQETGERFPIPSRIYLSSDDIMLLHKS